MKLRYMYTSKTIVTILLFTLSVFTYGQINDSIQPVNLEFITNKLENLSRDSDINLDYSDLLEEYIYYFENPVNINGENIVKLRDIYLINDIQLNNLRLYIVNFGQLMSIYELTSVTGFDKETVKNLEPFITFETVEKTERFKTRDAVRFGKHVLISRYDQILEKKRGYLTHPDSAIHYPGKVYLGNPGHYYFRYSFNYKDKIKAGFTLDKDAGEIFIKNNLSDSLKTILKNYNTYGFDFMSFFAYVGNIKFIEKIIVGDYHLEFGQGLTLWSGLAFGKSADAVYIRRYPRGIRANTSANENRFFRGITGTARLNNLMLTGFYSTNNIDANIVPSEFTEDDGVSSILETGFHRTLSELYDRNSLNVEVYGGNLTYKKSGISSGFTYYKTKLSRQIIPSENTFKLFDFHGDNMVNMGLDIAYSLDGVNLFGEFSRSSNGGMAAITGINTFLNDRFFLSFLFHHYDRNFQNIYNNPISVSSRKSNETGLYLGCKVLVSKNLSISGYIDHYRFPWLKYRVSSPSEGKDYLIHVNYNPDRNVSSFFRYRYKTKQENGVLLNKYLPSIFDYSRHDLRFFISWEISDLITMKNRVDYVLFKGQDNAHEIGYLAYQDVLFRPVVFPLQLTLRYSIFNTDGFNSRIYTYENDVLYAFSVPSYFDNGQRWYLMAKLKISNSLTMWLKYSKTTYFNKINIGTGNEEIDGNSRSEIKAQLRVKI